MLTITTDAASAIKGIVETSDASGGGLRIFAQPVNDSEASLELALTDEPGPGDQVVDAQGATVYLEQAAAAYLEDKVLDANVEGERVRFSIDQQPDETPG